MPSVPIVIPSEIAIVLNSIGVPPASRTPAFTWSASARKPKLHGIASVQVFAIEHQGLGEVLVGQADGVVEGAGRGAVAAVDDDRAACACVIGHGPRFALANPASS